MDAWNVLESGKNWGEADGELCEQLDFINSYVMHIQNLEKGKELVRKRDTVCQFLRKKEAYFGLAGKYQCRAFFGGFCKSDE